MKLTILHEGNNKIVNLIIKKIGKIIQSNELNMRMHPSSSSIILQDHDDRNLAFLNMTGHEIEIVLLKTGNPTLMGNIHIGDPDMIDKLQNAILRIDASRNF